MWVFTRSGGVWSQQGSKLVGTGSQGSAVQGGSVSLSSDGNTAIVGGYCDSNLTGAAWVFTRSGEVWSQQGSKLVGTGAVGNASQGVSVSISSDGNTAIIGGYVDNFDIDVGNVGTGAAWVFTRSGGIWSQQGSKLVGTGAIGSARQGTSVSISSDGNTAIVGGYLDNSGTGAVWVFTRSGGVWSQQGSKLVGTGAVGAANQGVSVSISSDGKTAIVGGVSDSSHTASAWIFTHNGTSILSMEPILPRISITHGNSIQFDVPQSEKVVIQLFNAKGKMLSQLLNDSRKAGLYNIPLPNEIKGVFNLLDYRAGNYHKTLIIQP